MSLAGIGLGERPMLERFEVEDLNGSLTYRMDFHPDLNIFTGRNGSGKTTILKMLWYLISANVERIPKEMTFKRVFLKATKFSIEIARIGEEQAIIGNTQYIFKYQIAGVDHEFVTTFDHIMHEVEPVRSAHFSISTAGPPTIFFPTFRRIEGGFALQPRRPEATGLIARLGNDDIATSMRGLLDQLSDRMSIDPHRFVASVSTQDVVQLLTRKYANVSDTTNKLHSALGKEIFEAIASYDYQKPEQSDTASLAGARETLSRISIAAKNVTEATEASLRPFTVLSELIGKTFEKRGIKITENIVLGPSEAVINSWDLSAGEKQMLSFLCYNAFHSGSPIFIDEPELSLHVDWQRSLMPILLSQQTGNQFIVATHSPFIYSKYPDKEFVIGEKGGE